MSAENVDNQQMSAEPSGTPRKDKKSTLYDKTFFVDIVDKIVSSKVEKLINSYGGNIIQTLEKSTSYLISDKMVENISCSESSSCRKDVEIKNVPCSKHKNSNDLINKANLLNIQILSAKQFQQWLKSLLKKWRVNKKPTDKVASVLRGKVSLKIESMDQGQCPVFEFIPKWPDLGDTLCKKKTTIPLQHNFSEDKSVDEYNSSDQYSTSEIGGMCELCDMPFMNYKEHINTKKHMRESQDEKKFHELDELINERPLNVIFNQFSHDGNTNKEHSSPFEASSVNNCIENTIITMVNSDPDNLQKNVSCSFSDSNHIKKDQISKKLKRNYSLDTNISFVPQKRPSNIHVPSATDINFYKKTKRKRKKSLKSSYKDIYKVEVVNNQSISSKNSSNNDVNDKPRVIIRLKRIKQSKRKMSSNVESHISSNEDDNNKIPDKSIPDQRYVRVVRKPSLTNETKCSLLSNTSTNNYLFTFEKPEVHKTYLDRISHYYPTNLCIPNTGSSIEHIEDKVLKLNNNGLNYSLSLKESLRLISKIKPEKIGEWFYNVSKKNEDDLSFKSIALIPSTSSTTNSTTNTIDSTNSSNSMPLL